MPNSTGDIQPIAGRFREGQEISSHQLRAIVDMLASRITGDNKTIRVRSFPGGQLLIESTAKLTKSGGGAYAVNAVGSLPAIPDSGMLEVYWDSTLNPYTGDNQIWRTYAGMSLWYPTQKSTAKVGTPST